MVWRARHVTLGGLADTGVAALPCVACGGVGRATVLRAAVDPALRTLAVALLAGVLALPVTAPVETGVEVVIVLNVVIGIIVIVFSNIKAGGAALELVLRTNGHRGGGSHLQLAD